MIFSYSWTLSKGMGDINGRFNLRFMSRNANHLNCFWAICSLSKVLQNSEHISLCNCVYKFQILKQNSLLNLFCTLHSVLKIALLKKQTVKSVVQKQLLTECADMTWSDYIWPQLRDISNTSQKPRKLSLLPFFN